MVAGNPHPARDDGNPRFDDLRKGCGRRAPQCWGFRTLDEAFEVLTLVQTGKLERFPVVVMGGHFWEHMRDVVRKTLVAEGAIAESELTLGQPAATPEEAVKIIKEAGREVPEQ
jgi:predicted Rossmann-fold nucleotide-binding protein